MSKLAHTKTAAAKRLAGTTDRDPVDVPLESISVPAERDRPAAERLGPSETGGPSGPEPTRFGDWERKGRCIDF